jgi:hypothetical protein
MRAVNSVRDPFVEAKFYLQEALQWLRRRHGAEPQQLVLKHERHRFNDKYHRLSVRTERRCPEMAADRYIVQPVPNGQFRVWDTKTQGIAYLPRTLSETTPSQGEAEDYAYRLTDCSSALAALRSDLHDPL